MDVKMAYFYFLGILCYNVNNISPPKMLSKFYFYLRGKIQELELTLSQMIQKRLAADGNSRLFYVSAIYLNFKLITFEILSDFIKFIVILFADPAQGFRLFYNQRDLQACPYSYSGFRQTQTKIRTFSAVGLATIVAVSVLTSIITNLIFGGKNPIEAASYTWDQASWSGNASSTARANHSQNQALWTYFASSSKIKVLSDGKFALSTTTLSTTSVNFSGNVASGTFLNNGLPTLKKQNGGHCSADAACASDYCANSGHCASPALACNNLSHACGNDCIYNNDRYATVQIGPLCVFAENMRTTKKPDGVTDIASLCHPTNGCATPWGRYYDVGTALNGSPQATSLGQKIQGICPANWHIPSDYNGGATDDMATLWSAIGSSNAMRLPGTVYWAAPNTGATNASGFGAAASGMYGAGSFQNVGASAYFLTSRFVSGWTGYRLLDLSTFQMREYTGGSYVVRCIKN